MRKSRILTASMLGNALEFYDFTLYGVFVAVLGRTFFPTSDLSLIASWAAFAAGFIMRPFGATVFGIIGDKFGRKKALTASILFMGIPTLVRSHWHCCSHVLKFWLCPMSLI